MAKKRYTLYLSRPLARQLDLVAQTRNGAKSALVEEALRLSLQPETHPSVDEGLARRLDDITRTLAHIRNDVSVAAETLALFVRYYLTITPPLPPDEQEPARLLGRQRFQVFVAEIGRRVAENQRLVTEVLESIAVHQPDLFAASIDSATAKDSVAPHNGATVRATFPLGARQNESAHG